MSSRARLIAATAISIALVSPASAAQHHGHPLAQTADLMPATPESVGFSSARLNRLEDAMHAAVDKGEVAGIVTLLARHGKVVTFDAYGKRSVALNLPMTKDTIVRMYSQTKPITAVAMLVLYEEGKWQLSDPVAKYVPEFASLKVFNGLDKDGKPILEDPKHAPTMRELVTHTAGFGYGLTDADYVDQQFQKQHVLQSHGLQEMVDKIATIPLLYQPGTRWSYSVGVDIQGYIIEKLSGQSLADFMADHIFKPLGMKDTGFAVPPDKVARFSSVYIKSAQTGGLVEVTPAMSPLVQDFTKPPLMDSGGGGSLSTAEDFARFSQMILNHGAFGTARVLSPASVELMESDVLENTVVPVAGDDDQPGFGSDAVGFGLDVGISKNPAKLGSLIGPGSIWWGGAAGTWFWIDPTNDLFFIGLIQRYGRGAAGDTQLVPLSQTLVYSALLYPSK